MTTPPTNVPATADAEEDAYDRPRIRCSCGFEVVGDDEFNNLRALDEHPCPNRPEEYTPWWGFVFSFWSWAIVIAICWGITQIMKAKGQH